MECLSFRPSSILAGIQPSVPASVRPCPGRQSQESFLRGKNAEDKFEEINQILKGRGLQIAYLTEIPVFVVSAVTTVQSNHPLLLIAIAGAALLVVLLTSPKVFRDLSHYIACTKFPEKRADRLGVAPLGQGRSHAGGVVFLAARRAKCHSAHCDRDLTTS